MQWGSTSLRHMVHNIALMRGVSACLSRATSLTRLLHRMQLHSASICKVVAAPQQLTPPAGSHYTNVYSSWTSFRWRFAPYLSQARLHIFTAIKYIGHLTARLEVSASQHASPFRQSPIDGHRLLCLPPLGWQESLAGRF